MLLVNGILCRIYYQRAANITGHAGREYVRFFIGKRAWAVKVALFAFWRRRKLKVYVVPVRELQTVRAMDSLYRQVCDRSQPEAEARLDRLRAGLG